MPNTNQLIEELSRKFNNNLALQLKPSNDTMIAVRTAKGLFQEALKQALSQTEQECDKKWRIKVEKSKLQPLDNVLPEFKPTEIYTKGYNQALQNLLDDLLNNK